MRKGWTHAGKSGKITDRNWNGRLLRAKRSGGGGLSMDETQSCQSCGYAVPARGRFCPKCGSRVVKKLDSGGTPESLNIRILYIMVGLLILAVLFPPWQTPPGEPLEFLGFHFILSPPVEGAQRSPVLQTVQLFTIAVAGLYFSWLFRSGPKK